MGLFDKEKLKEMASKAKDTVKDGIDEAIAEQKRRKELGLLDDVTVKLEYKGGHPALPKEKECSLKITNENITISYGLSSATVEFSTISNINFETVEQISKRITATRLVALNVFAFAFKKKTKDSEKYLTVEFTENGIGCAILFGGKKAQEAYSKLYERFVNFKKRETVNNDDVESIEKTQNTSSDPYEEIKKAKELLDIGIITQEEFDNKKKELLGL